MSELSTLVKRSDQIKSVLTRFINYKKSTDCDRGQIKYRRVKLKEAWKHV